MLLKFVARFAPHGRVEGRRDRVAVEDRQNEFTDCILQRTLPTFEGVPAAAVSEVRDVRVAGRSGSDRVTRLIVSKGRAEGVEYQRNGVAKTARASRESSPRGTWRS